MRIWRRISTWCRIHKVFFIRYGILYYRAKVQENRVEQLCLPECRIETVLTLEHDLPVSGYQAVRRTNDLISLSLLLSETTTTCSTVLC
jgi:hypothetical protein